MECRHPPDGSFYIPPFSGVSCNRVLLSAEKVEDLWLKTGHEAFYGETTGQRQSLKPLSLVSQRQLKLHWEVAEHW